MIPQAADKAVGFIDGLLHNYNEFLKQPVSTYCKLNTTLGENALVAEDGSLVTVMEHFGNLDNMGDKERINMVDTLLTSINSRLSGVGHTLQIIMTYDPDQALDEVKEIFEPSRITLKNFGIKIDDVMDDWQESVARYSSSEHVLIVAWTRPDILSKPELKSAKAKMRKGLLSAPIGDTIQNVGKVMVDLFGPHEAFITQLNDAFKETGMITETLDCHQALWWIRHELFPEFTTKNWRACIPGDPLPLKMSDKTWAPHDVTELIYPSFKKQLFPREAKNMSRTTIRMGDSIHAPVSLSLAPQTPLPFNRLFRNLINKQMPFRASFLFEGGKSLPFLGLKKILAQGLPSLNGVNKRYAKAVKAYFKRQENGITNVKFSASFDTWVFDDETPKSVKLLKKRKADLISTLQAWGSCDCEEVTGDPLLGVAATIPALMPVSPAPSCMPPLHDVLHMMPLTRMASIWREGSIPLRTPDGKLMPYAQGTDLQAAWIDVGAGGMGTGKSVWLNTMNWGFITQPGLTALPYLTVIDVGESSFGLIYLLQSLLPPDQKHVAQNFKLRMDPAYSINPCDLPLGCEHPIDRQKSFLVNLCCLLATPLDKTAPPNGIPGIARSAVEAVYDEYSEEMNPKPYTPGLSAELDQIIERMNIPVDEATTWREITTFFFDQEMYREASLAQRYAVPTLPNIAEIVRDPRVSDMYKDDMTPYGTTVPEYFWKCLIEAIQAYPILKNPTQFEIGDETKILSIDLEEVADKGGANANRQTTVMMMLARHAGAGRFFMRPEDVRYIPKQYRAYHHGKITQLRRLPKRLCFDEAHRYLDESVVTQFESDLKTASRESRKWDLHIGLYSQAMTDFPKIILDLATSIFVLGSGTNTAVKYIQDTFGINDSCVGVIKNLSKPKAYGATFFAMFRVDGARENGFACQVLTSTLGQQIYWAFSSTSEDKNVRDPLYKKIGVTQTLKLLAKRYPGGVKGVVQKRKAQVAQRDEHEATNDVIEEIIDEILNLTA